MFLQRQLLEAIRNGSYNKIKKIAKQGLDFNFSIAHIVDRDMSPLQYALSRNFYSCEMAKELIDNGANPHLLNDKNENAFFYVQSIDAIDLLLSYGIDFSLKDNHGLQAFCSREINLKDDKVKKYLKELIVISEEKAKFENELEGKVATHIKRKI